MLRQMVENWDWGLGLASERGMLERQLVVLKAGLRLLEKRTEKGLELESEILDLESVDLGLVIVEVD